MFIRIGYEIGIDSKADTVLILALSPHSSFDGRIIGSADVQATPDLPMETFLDGFGNRLTRLRAPAGPLTLWSDCIVEVDGKPDEFDWTAEQHDVGDLPPETLQFLTASRYCDSDARRRGARPVRLHPAGMGQGAGDLQPRPQPPDVRIRVRPFRQDRQRRAMREKTGVCRDFAHLAIALCRAMNIPARYASGYLGDIGVPYSGPGDFCAWFEAYLGGRWYTFDARYNTPRIGRVLMVRGRDAADGAMITSFGAYDLKTFRVWTDEVPGTPTEASLQDMLTSRPETEALQPTG
jgi:transglutaminase-like putative cysteine protease